jgi:hypothetical protein
MTWLKHRLEELSYTHDDLRGRLAQLGVKRVRATITGWVNGKSIKLLCNPKEAEILARALRWNLTEMLMAAGYKIDPGIGLSSELQPFLKNYEELPVSRRELFVQTLQHFSQYAANLSEIELEQALHDGDVSVKS